MWRFIKNSNGIKNKKHAIPTLHVEEDKLTEDMEKANEFASFYQSIGKNRKDDTSNPHVENLFQQDADEGLSLAINEAFHIHELEKVLKD